MLERSGPVVTTQLFLSSTSIFIEDTLQKTGNDAFGRFWWLDLDRPNDTPHDGTIWCFPRVDCLLWIQQCFCHARRHCPYTRLLGLPLNASLMPADCCSRPPSTHSVKRRFKRRSSRTFGHFRHDSFSNTARRVTKREISFTTLLAWESIADIAGYGFLCSGRLVDSTTLLLRLSTVVTLDSMDRWADRNL
jgi:hypothetical protein